MWLLTNSNFSSRALQRMPSLFLGCRAPSSVDGSLPSTAQLQSPGYSGSHCPEKLLPLRLPTVPSQTGGSLDDAHPLVCHQANRAKLEFPGKNPAFSGHRKSPSTEPRASHDLNPLSNLVGPDHLLQNAVVPGPKDLTRPVPDNVQDYAHICRVTSVRLGVVVAANQSQRPNGGHDGKHRRGQRNGQHSERDPNR